MGAPSTTTSAEAEATGTPAATASSSNLPPMTLWRVLCDGDDNDPSEEGEQEDNDGELAKFDDCSGWRRDANTLRIFALSSSCSFFSCSLSSHFACVAAASNRLSNRKLDTIPEVASAFESVACATFNKL